MKKKTQIWTIGHGNRSIDTFLGLLQEHGIQVLVDVRSFPTSRIEHFKRANRKMACRKSNRICMARQGTWRLSQRWIQTACSKQTFQRRHRTTSRNRKERAGMHRLHGGKSKILSPKIHFSIFRRKGR